MTEPGAPAAARPVRVGVQLHPQHGDWPALLRAACAVEELGADALYTWDHFFPLYGPPDGAHLECWSVLAAWAAVTERVELGPLVSCTSYRNHHLLADMARTVDRVSGGRLVLGLGAGWFRRDYDEYGYDLGTARSRLAGLEAALRTVPERWSRLVPPPAHRVPILVGGTGRRVTLRLVATHADRWHAMFPSHPGEVAPLAVALDEWCDRVGRPPADVERGVGIEPDRLGHDLAAHADDYVALGFTEVTLGVNGPAWDVGPVREWLAWRDERNAGRDR